MKLYFSDGPYLELLKREQDWPYARLLLGDGWRPLSEYIYDKSYVYAAGVNAIDLYRIFGGRGGKYRHSEWWSPNNKEIPVPLVVTHWQPLPPGVDPGRHALALFPTARDEKPPPRPEPVYAPGSPAARLTPQPRDLLVAMAGGAVLHERAWQWTSWTLQRPGEQPAKITARGVDRLREVAFIERVGVRPIGELERFHTFDWRVTDAGHAWLAANKRA